MKRKEFLIRALAIEVFCSLLIFTLASIWIQDHAILVVIGAGTLTMFLILLFSLNKRARLRQKETQMLLQEIQRLSEWPYLEYGCTYKTPEASLIADSIRRYTVKEERCACLVDKEEFLKRIGKTVLFFKNKSLFLLYFKFSEAQKEKAMAIIREAFPHRCIYAREDGLFLLEDTPTHEKEIQYRAQKVIAKVLNVSQDEAIQIFAMAHPYHSIDEMLSWVSGADIDSSQYPLECIYKLSRADIERAEEEEEVDLDVPQCVFGSATYLPSQNAYYIKEETRCKASSFLFISEEGFVDSMDVSLLLESKFRPITYYSSRGNEGFIPSLLEAINAKGIYFRYVRIDEEIVGFVYALAEDEGLLSKEQFQKLEWEFARREKELLVSSCKNMALNRCQADRLFFQTPQTHPHKIKNKEVCSVIENRVNSGKAGALLFMCRLHKGGEASALWRNVFKRLHYENLLTCFTSLNENEALFFLDGQQTENQAIAIMKALHRPLLIEGQTQKIDFAFFYLSYPADFFHPNEALALWHQHLKGPSGRNPFSLEKPDGGVHYSCAHNCSNPTGNRIQGYLDSSGHLRFLHILLNKDESQEVNDFLSVLIRHKRQINKSHIQKIFLEIDASHIDDRILKAIKDFLDRLPRFHDQILVLTHRRLDYFTRKALEEMKIESIDYEQCNILRFYAGETIFSLAEKGTILQKDSSIIHLGKPSSQEEAKLAFAIGIDAIAKDISVEEFPNILRKNTLNWN